MAVQRLADNIINQIAAGEVIERPASVVRELLDNAIDANATRIEIVTAGGGKNLIRVTDNGHGMSVDDIVWKWVPTGMPGWKPETELQTDILAIANGFKTHLDV